ncbi:hypothetical protein BDK51DRAFT_40898 [Blyttiomyces helicus]|uniref:PH domain-containing protein n=1 Tax=Blyttiomyces helicus TaxID=388810 RepID=A0A4P9W878_9FUNG|nr:hypothetical protein BDK51DRAFT_40898 [Blyttiomyces helicus]|eukprot:RKO88534.1 hypothetical protein BDK51DRAFT_40898 [Blyttiomyces helicus]
MERDEDLVIHLALTGQDLLAQNQTLEKQLTEARSETNRLRTQLSTQQHAPPAYVTPSPDRFPPVVRPCVHCGMDGRDPIDTASHPFTRLGEMQEELALARRDASNQSRIVVQMAGRIELLKEQLTLAQEELLDARSGDRESRRTEMMWRRENGKQVERMGALLASQRARIEELEGVVRERDAVVEEMGQRVEVGHAAELEIGRMLAEAREKIEEYRAREMAGRFTPSPVEVVNCSRPHDGDLCDAAIDTDNRAPSPAKFAHPIHFAVIGGTTEQGNLTAIADQVSAIAVALRPDVFNSNGDESVTSGTIMIEHADTPKECVVVIHPDSAFEPPIAAETSDSVPDGSAISGAAATTGIADETTESVLAISPHSAFDQAMVPVAAEPMQSPTFSSDTDSAEYDPSAGLAASLPALEKLFHEMNAWSPFATLPLSSAATTPEKTLTPPSIKPILKRQRSSSERRVLFAGIEEAPYVVFEEEEEYEEQEGVEVVQEGSEECEKVEDGEEEEEEEEEADDEETEEEAEEKDVLKADGLEVGEELDEYAESEVRMGINGGADSEPDAELNGADLEPTEEFFHDEIAINAEQQALFAHPSASAAVARVLAGRWIIKYGQLTKLPKPRFVSVDPRSCTVSWCANSGVVSTAKIQSLENVRPGRNQGKQFVLRTSAGVHRFACSTEEDAAMWRLELYSEPTASSATEPSL